MVVFFIEYSELVRLSIGLDTGKECVVMPLKTGLAVLLILCAALTGPAPAWAANSGQAGRFSMQATENGMLRLDTQTGAVSICTFRDDSWSCARIDDDSEALDARLREMTGENRKLHDEIARLRSELEARPADGTAEPGNSRSAIPNEEELEKAFSFLERMLKKFKGLVEDLDEKSPKGTPL